MDAKEERLVARLRHHNPTLTVTELDIGAVDHTKKNLVIDYINSLKLNAIVESSPGLETVVSVDLSSRTEQDTIFKKLFAFIRDIGIDDISITSEPFEEQRPEIDSTGSIQPIESSSRDYTPLHSEDIEELISQDKSDSEFELILSRPRRSSSRESRWLHSDQSSKDVIGSILKVSEGGRSQSSGWSLIQHSIRALDRSCRNRKPKSRHPIYTFWSRAKKLFKKKRNPPKQVVGQLQAMVSKDSIQAEGRKSNDEGRPKDSSILRDINTVTRPNQVSLNTLQKRLEKVSRDVFSMKNKCPGMKTDGPSLDVYTQTPNKHVEESVLKNKRISKVDKKCSNIEPPSKKCYITQHNQVHPVAESISMISISSSSSESENQVLKGRVKMARQSLRGMVPNLIPIYHSVPADLKRPVMCELKPVGGPFFFRRMNSTKGSSYSTGTSCLTTTTTPSLKSTRSTVTFSSLSCPSISQEQYVESGSCSFESVLYNRPGHRYFSYGLVSTQGVSPFERERPKKTQTVRPPHRVKEINTTEVFKLPKETQTRPKKRKKPPVAENVLSIGTQTFACSSSTSCTELLSKKSCGTKTENEIEKVDKENSCYLLTKQATETKETNSETAMPKCETCQGMTDKQIVKKRKSPVKQKNDKLVTRGINWGQYPDGSFGFGQCYAPGKVFPIVSMATGFSTSNPFAASVAKKKGGNQPCPKICNLFGGKKKALLEELQKQKLELMQMKMVLVAINEELLAECSDTSSEDNNQSSDERYPSSEHQATLKHNKKVTFREPLVNERILSYANHC